MPIDYARRETLSRSRGQSAVRTASYNGREPLFDERTGEGHDFCDHEAPVHHAVLLPEGAPEEYRDPEVLWNAVEAAERRRDSQVAHQFVLALPADREITHEDRVALAESFAREHFVSNGLAVQLDIHAPDEDERDSEQANWHAHLLVTTRRVGPDGLSRLKARDLEPEVRRVGGSSQVVEGPAWNMLWRAHQDRYFREQGYDIQVDPNGLISENHVGPVRMRRESSEAVELLQELRLANREATFDPDKVLQALTRMSATFSERELDRLLKRQLGSTEEAAEDIALARTAVMESPDLVVLYDPETGERSDRFTTRQVREQEEAALAAAASLSARGTGGVSAESVQHARGRWALRRDQEEAFDYATSAGHLKLIAGRAGTGKSYTLSAIREAYERDGRFVMGLAPTNVVVQDMRADGFRNAATIHSALYQLEKGMLHWNANSVIMVDEAGMIDTPIMRVLLTEAERRGAKLLLVGDERQLPSVMRGGMFPELQQRHPWAEITEVARQEVDWQRQAARDLAEYRFGAAVEAFERNRQISWNDTHGAAREALVAAWTRDRDLYPGENQFVFAYTNKDVDALNETLRAVCRERGDLVGPDHRVGVRYRAAGEGEEVERHEVCFAVGDRVQFTGTDKALEIYNGSVGTITAFDPQTGEMAARMDGPVIGPAREVRWNVNEFDQVRHGYAGTIYKGQGKTLDRTYLYHSSHWTAAPSYVALTRQRKNATIFVSRETVKGTKHLARQMARQDMKVASIAWTAGEAGGDTELAHGLSASAEAASSVNAQGGEGRAGPSGVSQRNLETGRARFLKRLEARRQGLRVSFERMQARRFLHEWSLRIAAFRAALPGMEEDNADYARARANLLALADLVQEPAVRTEVVRQIDPAADPPEHTTLLNLAAHTDPNRVLADFVVQAERDRQDRTRPAPAATQNPQQRETPAARQEHPHRRDPDRGR